jgi:transposase
VFTMIESMKHYTPYEKELRLRWYRLVEADHRPVGEVCVLYGIPRKTYYKWYVRDHGYGSNDYHARQKDRKTKLTHDIKVFIEATKRKANYGPLKMKLAVKRAYGVDVSTTIIYRYYKRKGLVRKPQRKLGWHAPLKEPLIITKPGQGVQLDVKYVYPHGRREYQFTVLDPFTEFCYAEIFPTRESKNAALTIERAAVYFGFPILSVQTDNGSEFRGNFHGWCEARGIPHFFIPKKSPYWNGKVERVHRTVDEEFYQNLRREWKTLAEWLEWYNTERIHLSIDGMTPREKADLVLSTVTS